MLKLIIYLIYGIGCFLFYGFTYGHFKEKLYSKNKFDIWFNRIICLIFSFSSFIGILIMYLELLYIEKRKDYFKYFSLY